MVETILEREDHARVVVMGKRGVGHEYRLRPYRLDDRARGEVERKAGAGRIARVLRNREHVVFAYDASPAAERALERLANSPLFDGLPVTIVMAEADGEAQA